MKTIVVIFWVLALCCFCFCSDQNQGGDLVTEKKLGKDTVFVKVDVNNSNKDSLEKIYGKFVTPETQALLDRGEFVFAKIRLSIPLFPPNWTSDFEDIFTDAEQNALDSLLSAYEAKTTNEIGVVSVDTNWTSREEFEKFVLRLHNFWGLGKKDKNNGILIGISSGYKLVRISNGYGIEKTLTDAETDSIVHRVMIPHFAKENYYAGTRAGVLAIMKELK